jgi:Ca-activated chloride channel family protein
MRIRIASLSAFLVVLGLAGSSRAQERPSTLNSSSHHPFSLTVNVDLVLVPVTVTDDQSRFVSGLQAGNFQIWEDNVEQEVKFVSAEDAPISVGIILDMSGSMKDKLGVALDAATTFLRTVLNKDDEFFVVDFADRPRVAVDFTTEISRISDDVVTAHARGSTALYDAVYLGLDKLRDATNTRKLLLLITDGEDNRSRYTFSNIREYVQERDVQIYSIGIVDPSNSPFVSEGEGRARIEKLTEFTGGQSFFPKSVYDLEDICFKLGIEIKNQYVIAYRSTNSTPDGKLRKLRVKAHARGPGGLHVRARSGYYAVPDMRSSGN